MTSNILIKNIYYMLTYVFEDLTNPIYENVNTESFEDIHNLYAAILIKGISKQLKQGLHKEYINYQEDIPMIRGKIDISGTIRNEIQRKPLVSVEYDDLTEDNIYNQILKTTAVNLVNSKKIKLDDKYRLKLKQLLLYFKNINLINLNSVNWTRIPFMRHNQSYVLMVNICYLLFNQVIQTTDSGEHWMADYSDQNLSSLFEKFVLNYYKRNFSASYSVRSSHIKWALTNNADPASHKVLPIMKSDIIIESVKKSLIIDTKFYNNIYQYNFDTQKNRNMHLYQIYSYVKNYEYANDTKEVSGLLLYAQTYHETVPEYNHEITQNKIFIRSVDLNKPFNEICKQLDMILSLL